MNIKNEIYNIGIVPVIKIEDENDAIPLAQALIDGGVFCAEITFRTKAAVKAIKLITDRFPEMIIGAGTVLDSKQVDQAVSAGAKFIVSPGFNPTTVEHCIQNNILIIPGCSTASNIEQAISYGLDVVKFFPAEASGGLNTIKALSGPFSNVRFMPTGGINKDNVNEYLAFDKVIACGGTWMVKEDLIRSKNFDEITRLTQAAVKGMHNITLQKIYINSKDDIQDVSNKFSLLLNSEIKDNNGSLVIDGLIEVVSKKDHTSKNTLVFATNNISRAISYLKRVGFDFDENDKSDYDNKLKSINLKDKIGDFEIKLLEI